MAKNSISKISNAFSTGGGGVNFEQQIQAMFLLSLLIDGFCPAMNEQTKKVHFQAKHLGHDVHWIDPEGKPELELAEDYENKANIAESRGYSRYAGILRGVADEFKREAKSNILEAKNGDDE